MEDNETRLCSNTPADILLRYDEAKYALTEIEKEEHKRPSLMRSIFGMLDNIMEAIAGAPTMESIENDLRRSNKSYWLTEKEMIEKRWGK